MMASSARVRVPRRIRHRIGPWIDRFARRIGQPEYHVHPAGYVGTVRLPIADVEATLRDGGFGWDPISLYHYTQAGSSTDGSWVYRSSLLADRQLHVVLFSQAPDRTDVYAHTEFSWLRHPFKHAEEENIRREEGVAEMRRWLDAQGLEYERESVVRRRAEHVVERIRESLGG